MIAILLPFRIDGYGRVATTTDPIQIWSTRVRSVLTTLVGERVMRPDFGCDVVSELFDAVEETPELVEQDIRSAFSQWLPELTLDEVSLAYSSNENGEVEMTVSYSIPNDTSVTDTLILPFNLE